MSQQRPKHAPPGYREPAPATTASPRRGVVVSRPDDDALAPPVRRPVPLPPPPRSPTYWERHPEFVRHPRVIGGVLAVIGGGITWSLLDTLENGGSYSRRGPVLGMVGLCVGVWPLLFGCPLDDEGHPPFWWTAGFVGCAIAGFGGGFVLSALLAT